jgi:hypothetical protein
MQFIFRRHTESGPLQKLILLEPHEADVLSHWRSGSADIRHGNLRDQSPERLI